MSLLPLAKTWQIDRDINVGSAPGATEINQRWYLALKNALIGFASNPLTVAGSSDGTAGGMDAVDRWGVFGDIAISTSFPRAWIVLEFANGAQILFDMFEDSDAYWYYSPSGAYTGGDHNSLPTATDQITLWTNRPQGGQASGGTDNHTLHVWLSSDGNSARFVTGRDGVAAGVCVLDTDLVDPVSGWATKPNFFCLAGTGSSSAGGRGGSNEFDATDANSAYDIDGTGTVGTAYMAGGAFNDQGYSDQVGNVNAKSSEYQFARIRMQSLEAGDEGSHGRPADLWWGALNRNGSVYEESGSFFAQFDQLILPWPDNVGPTL